MIDTRTPIALQTNKKHDAGVTFLKEIDENKLLTGSYDCSLKTWDRRKLNTEIDSLYTERQIWDLKFNTYNDDAQDFNFSIACVYDGYQFGNMDKDFTLSNLTLELYEGHESICYANEFTKDGNILTSSFYDSTL